MSAAVDARTLYAMLHDGREVALADAREHGQYGRGHPLLCTSIPWSQWELELPRLVPNRRVRLVVYDQNDEGIAHQAAARAETLGYRAVYVLTGGLEAWRAAGYTTFAGVHVPSKAFGELVEQEFGTPSISAAELAERQRRGERLAILDGRPWEEYRAMNIPGSTSCPNGELIYRLGEVVPDDETPIVVNCAGRTRSIIGCETLRQFGVANPVYALRNGTMGWRLAGLELEHGSARRASVTTPDNALGERRKRAIAMAERAGVTFASSSLVREWCADETRTTYLLDVRDPREYVQAHLAGASSAPAGQLIQATDHWIGVCGARLVLIDDTEARAAACAFWLAQMGFDTSVLAGGREGWWALECGVATAPSAVARAKRIEPEALAAALASTAPPLLLDTRRSMAYREGHVPQADWVIRPRLNAALAARNSASKPLVLIGDDDGAEDLLAVDVAGRGISEVAVVAGGYAAWRRIGGALAATPNYPLDDECIDFLFFVHDRHAGNLRAAEQYLAWEQGLIAQLDASERAIFEPVTNGARRAP